MHKKRIFVIAGWARMAKPPIGHWPEARKRLGGYGIFSTLVGVSFGIYYQELKSNDRFGLIAWQIVGELRITLYLCIHSP